MAGDVAQFIVGIDLGTTNTVVAYCDTQLEYAGEDKAASIHLFEMEQLTAPGEIQRKVLLPSLRYHPAEGELPEEQIRLPWHVDKQHSQLPDTKTPNTGTSSTFLIGDYAKQLSSRVAGRSVVSAKSWLCHPNVDRTADILPWGGAEGVQKVSPCEASASYLNYVRQSWNFHYPEAPLEEQEVVLTVPASFDEMARALTLEAAKSCGLKKLKLIEEPQAVCYDWLSRNQNDLSASLEGAKLLLVCDVGGGTADLTLIKIEYPENGPPELSRIGVGDHLMLGGDNLDLAIAHIAERRFGEQKKLSTRVLSQLIQQCRNAKEILLGDNPPEEVSVTLLGAGSKLIGASRSVNISRQEVVDMALEGFFPLVSLDSSPKKSRSGLQEFGLPYEADAAVTRHVAAFLNHYQDACKEILGNGLAVFEGAAVPDALLLNGGVFRSERLQNRLRSQLEQWSDKDVALFENGHPDLAVARGAVASGLARRGEHAKIGADSARSYFLVLDKADEGICLLPSGTKENCTVKLDHQFLLKVGAPVQFNLVSSTIDQRFDPGQVVKLSDPALFPALPPLAAVMKKRGKMKSSEVEVELASELSDVGTLAVECVSTEDCNRRWLLDFNLRGSPKNQLEVDLHPRTQLAKEKISVVYGERSKGLKGNESKKLRPDLEKLLGKREQWDTPLLRELSSDFLNGAKRRKRSDAHERIWFGLAGYCLRPGFGYPVDEWRIEQVFPLYDQGLQYRKDAKVWADWWNFWRRVSGGLNQSQQEKIYRDVLPYLQPVPEKSKAHLEGLKRKGYLAYDDMVRLAAGLENITLEEKVFLGEGLLERLQKKNESPQTWWAIGRIAAREPLYCSNHNLVLVDTVEQWLDRVLDADWHVASQAAFAATVMSKKTGDRSLDISPEKQKAVIAQLKKYKCPRNWIAIVESKVALDAADTKRFYGDTLPVGLSLVKGNL